MSVIIIMELCSFAVLLSSLNIILSVFTFADNIGLLFSVFNLKPYIDYGLVF